MANPGRTETLPSLPNVRPHVAERVARDYVRFADSGGPDSLDDYLRDEYGLDLETAYGGHRLKNPWGKASGQLSMTSRQVAEDVEAGLGFVVLKTVIAENAAGNRRMEAWAIKEARMVAEQIVGASGDRGWTVTWNGRGWWQSLDDYLQLIREAQSIANGTGTLIVPSCKYHLPHPDETEWDTPEYEHTTRRILDVWKEGRTETPAPMPLEKDFSPTLAGSELSAAKSRILDWMRTVTELIRQAAADRTTSPRIAVGLKVFNSLFDDEFQLEMLGAIHEAGTARPNFFVYGNRLFDPNREFDGHRGVAYGGPDLSDRNLRIMSRFQSAAGRADFSAPLLPWSATGNICTGKMALEYALLGASSFQIHTFFQLPADQYRMKRGSKTQKALHELYFHPTEGFIVWMDHLAHVLNLPKERIRLRDVIGQAPRLAQSARS